MANILRPGTDAPERKTVFGLPARAILPVAGGVVLIAGVVVALMFLLPEQGTAQNNPTPIANKTPATHQSAEAQPPRNTNADPPLVLNPSDLYQDRSVGTDNVDK
jgi:hypothetical protein